jgi:hypothetical protein
MLLSFGLPLKRSSPIRSCDYTCGFCAISRRASGKTGSLAEATQKMTS